MGATSGPHLWDEVAARHNEKVSKAQKDYEMAADAFDTGKPSGRKKVEGYKKKLERAKRGK